MGYTKQKDVKYDIKILNMVQGVKMSGCYNVFKLKRSSTENNNIYVVIYEPHGNHKPNDQKPV